LGGLIAGGLALGWRVFRYVSGGGGGMFDRVVFVCCNDAGDCHSSPADPKAPAKAVVKRIDGLRLGG
jgi:hypothetical protein